MNGGEILLSRSCWVLAASWLEGDWMSGVVVIPASKCQGKEKYGEGQIREDVCLPFGWVQTG